MTAEQLAMFDPDACQRWRAGAHTWVPADGGDFAAAWYTAAPIDEATARAFVIRHHYSRSYPAGRAQYGMFERVARLHLVGVAVVGQPMSNRVTGNVFPTLGGTAAELSRFVLLDEVPRNGETWLLGQLASMAAADGLRGLVAFADPMPRRTAAGALLMPGHVGHIYRVRCGVDGDGPGGVSGRYTGRATPRTLVLLPDGRVFSARTRAKVTGWERGAAGAVRELLTLAFPDVTDAGGWAATTARLADAGRQTRSAWLAEMLGFIGARTVRHRGNHRYAWTLGSARQRRRTPIALPAEKYPTTVDEVPA